MTDSTASSPSTKLELPSSVKIISWLGVAVAPLGAALAFIIQPMMGKLLLPRLGGTSATWLGAALFFQLSLLLGYAWGLWLSRRPVKFQLVSIAVLCVVAVAAFHAPDSFSGSPTIPAVGLSLSVSCLPVMMLLFSLSPWLHAWRERLGAPQPYALYAISNIGGLGALLAYPLVVETLLPLSDQLAIWRGFLVLLAALVTGGCLLLWSAEKRNPSPPSALVSPSGIPVDKWPVWIALSAVSCAVMLAAVNLVAVEIGSTPLTWVGPLGVYLASFALIFSGRWQPWMTGASAVGLALSLAVYMMLKGFGAATVDGPRLLALVACCGFASLVGNALLHETRPLRGGEWFYLALAIGGAIGGLASIWIVPAVFAKPVEFAVGASVLLAAALFWGARWRHTGTAAACLAIATGPVFILGWKQADADRMETGMISNYRDENGYLMVKTDASSVVLSSATTQHGTQMIENDETRRRPTLYYTESSGVGRAITRLQTARTSIRVAVVGLGAGTLATYARPGDEFVFYDIDPKIETVARTHFSFLADCRGQARVELADGRRALAESGEDFDLVVIDAFMGDGIPAHLLTREALAIYQLRTKARDGLVIIHASTRHSRFFPIIAATAKTLRQESLGVETDIKSSTESSDWDPAISNYILLGSPARANEWNFWFAREEDDGRVSRSLVRLDAMMTSPFGIWTDERSAMLDVLDIGGLISW